MRMITLYDKNGISIGSVYELSKTGVLIDIEEMCGLIWVKSPDLMSLDMIRRAVMSGMTSEIAVELDTDPEESYILRIKKKVLRIVNRNGRCIYKVKCMNTFLENDPDFEDKTFFPKRTTYVRDKAEIKNSNHLNIFDGDSYLGTMYFFQDGRTIIDLINVEGVFDIDVNYNIEMHSICNYINYDLGLIDLDAERIEVDSIWNYLDASPNPKDMDPKYKLTINNKKLSIIDKNGIIIYTRACNRAEEKTVEKCY